MSATPAPLGSTLRLSAPVCTFQHPSAPFSTRLRWRTVALIGLLVFVSCGSSTVGPGPVRGTVPTITSVSPESGPIGTTIVVRGSDFARTGNTIRFGTAFIKELPSTDGKSVEFAVPATLDQCPPSSLGMALPCSQFQPPVVPGEYRISAITRAGVSTDKVFTVTTPGSFSRASGRLAKRKLLVS